MAQFPGEHRPFRAEIMQISPDIRPKARTRADGRAGRGGMEREGTFVAERHALASRSIKSPRMAAVVVPRRSRNFVPPRLASEETPESRDAPDRRERSEISSRWRIRFNSRSAGGENSRADYREERMERGYLRRASSSPSTLDVAESLSA